MHYTANKDDPAKPSVKDWGFAESFRKGVIAIIRNVVKPECLIDDQGTKPKSV